MLKSSFKAFPGRFRTGVDIAQYSRYQEFVAKKSRFYLKRWGRKIFNPVEEPEWRNLLRQDASSDEKIARFISSRFALKEAAIKASFGRKLTYKEVSVMKDLNFRPRVFVDPPGRDVLLEEGIAKKRGLSLDTGKLGTRDIVELRELFPTLNWERFVYVRPRRIPWAERQEVDASLSHDGDYVFAHCQMYHGLVQENTEVLQPMIDYGDGPSKHACYESDRAVNYGDYPWELSKAEGPRLEVADAMEYMRSLYMAAQMASRREGKLVKKEEDLIRREESLENSEEGKRAESWSEAAQEGNANKRLENIVRYLDG